MKLDKTIYGCETINLLGSWGLLQYGNGSLSPTKIGLSISYPSRCQIVFKKIHGAQQLHWQALCKFRNNLTTNINVLDERDFTGFEFNMCFGGYLVLQQSPGLIILPVVWIFFLLSHSLINQFYGLNARVFSNLLVPQPMQGMMDDLIVS